jgi:hypothetical protein
VLKTAGERGVEEIIEEIKYLEDVISTIQICKICRKDVNLNWGGIEVGRGIWVHFGFASGCSLDLNLGEIEMLNLI